MNPPTPRRLRRPVAIAGAAALALALTPGGAVAQLADDGPESRGIDRVCPPPADDAAEVEFSDTEDNAHEDAIQCMAEYRIARGYGDGSYRPRNPVTRGQMATFVANWIVTATGEDLAYDDADDYFPDIADHEHEAAIKALAEAGVVSGRQSGRYDPNSPVLRGQMARFIANAIDYADTFDVDGSLPPEDDTVYFDDADGSPFQDDIQRLAGVGIVEGNTAGDYRPLARVFRDQMASFLMRGADYGDRMQRWLPTAVEEDFDVTMTGLAVLHGETNLPAQGEMTATAEFSMTVDAFEGVLAWELDLSDVTGPYGDDGLLTIHRGTFSQNGPVVATLATGSVLDADADGIVTGTLTEDDATERFAEFLENPGDFYVLLTSDEYPDGAVRGQLDGVTPTLPIADPPGEQPES